MENTNIKLGENKGTTAEKVDEKLQNVLEKNRELKSMFITRDTLNGNNLDEDFHYNLTSGNVAKFKYVKITSCDVERGFNKYKNIQRSDRRSFIFENFKHHIIVSCNNFE